MDDVVRDRFDLAVLARVAATPRPGDRDLLTAMQRWLPATTAADVAAAMARHRTAGRVGDDGLRDLGTAWLRDRLGKCPTEWRYVADRALPLSALGWRDEDKKVRDRVAKDGWPAAIVARDLGLLNTGPPIGPTQLLDLLVWRSLDLAGLPRQTPAAIRSLALSRLVEGAGQPERLLRLLAARATTAARADLKAIRDGVVRTWLLGRDWMLPSTSVHSLLAPARPAAAATATAPPPRPPTAAPREELDRFAERVRERARAAVDGRYGDRKVFISELWRSLRDGGGLGPISLEAFKARLVEANRKGLVRLHRADLANEMDPTEVAASATQYLDATFHFVEREETP